MKKFLLFSLVFFISTNYLLAQAGRIDSSFANNGVLVLPDVVEAYDMIQLGKEI